MKRETQENNLKEKSEWAKKEEVIKTSFPIYLSLGIIKFMPQFFLRFITRCVALFYFLFSGRVRKECTQFQNQLSKTNENVKFKAKDVFRQIFSFAITVTEKMECWVKNKFDVKIQFHDDDVQQLIDELNKGNGAFVICSHLGNSEVLRNLATHNKIYLNKEIESSVLMDLGTTTNFANTIEKINPGFSKNIVDINNITPATIEVLQQTIESGGLVVSAGDRISKNANSRYLTVPFLKKDAPWSYGVFLLAMLLKAPVYFMFGIRNGDTSFNHEYNFYITKSSVDTNCPRKERETKLLELCLEFVKELEKRCIESPLQWYNFYDFWRMPDGSENDT